MTTIEVKTKFGGWTQVSPEVAMRWAQSYFAGITARMSDDDRAAHVNCHLRGVQFSREDLKKSPGSFTVIK